MNNILGDGQGVCTCIICSAAKSKMKTINIKVDIISFSNISFVKSLLKPIKSRNVNPPLN